MAYNELLADRIRVALGEHPGLEEKLMFGGICFMIDDKMCIGVVKDEIMCRIDPKLEEAALERTGCRPMDFTRKSMKGFVFVGEEGLRGKSDLDYWIRLCLDFNPHAKSSKKKSKS